MTSRMATAGSTGRHDDEARVVMARVARTFDLATRILPPDIRTDVRRLYLVLRTLDDLVDHGHPDAGVRVGAVEAWAGGGAPSSREAGLLDDLASRHPGLPRDAVLDFCAGMRADLAGPRHATSGDLDRYCYQVAGTVGRLMAPLVGVHPACSAEADLAACAMGAAMQRTNILRDVREDARIGRVYLPDETLAAADVAPGDATALLDLPAWPLARRRALLAGEIDRADADYRAGLAGVRRLIRGRTGIRAAAMMYREVLREIERDHYATSGRRAIVPRRRKLRLIARSLLEDRW